MKTIFTTLLCAATFLCSAQTLTPRHYSIPRVATAINVDGDIYNDEWSGAQWTDNFVDIKGYDVDLSKIYPTRAKMMYDDKNLYIAIEMIEPHIWATIDKRDSTLYLDNDIEVFLDPDCDSKNYMEFEFNAKGTLWDLIITEPYSKGGKGISEWNMKGMEWSTKIYGTLNDATDDDDKWVVEIAMPFSEIQKYSTNKDKLLKGQTWKLNFLRVQWLKFDVVDGKYRKLRSIGAFGGEDYWAWSPTGAVNIHRPELWGTATFE